MIRSGDSSCRFGLCILDYMFRVNIEASFFVYFTTAVVIAQQYTTVVSLMSYSLSFRQTEKVGLMMSCRVLTVKDLEELVKLISNQQG